MPPVRAVLFAGVRMRSSKETSRVGTEIERVLTANGNLHLVSTGVNNQRHLWIIDERDNRM